MKRFQARRSGGRFTRNTAENTLGMHFGVHEWKFNGEWCGAFNPSKVGEDRPETCHACGESLSVREAWEDDNHARAREFGE